LLNHLVFEKHLMHAFHRPSLLKKTKHINPTSII
jgi:hypothetical protein